MSNARPCDKCPWISKAPRDIEITNRPDMQEALKRGSWFCCHVNMGTCWGAKILHDALVRRTSGRTTRR